mgnify:CR=1 FL=1
MSTRYTKEFLEPYVRESHSIHELLRTLGVTSSGKAHAAMRKVLSDLSIPVDHFSRSTPRRKPELLTPESIFVLGRTGRRENSSVLRRALRAVGVQEVCKCGVGTIWEGDALTLHVDHINGDPVDNRRENLRFLCLNCHSQTSNYGVKNQALKVKAPKKKNSCLGCGIPVWKPYLRCVTCANRATPKIRLFKPKKTIAWPSKEELEVLVWDKPLQVIAKACGGSHTGLRKHLKKIGVTSLPERGYWIKRKLM